MSSAIPVARGIAGHRDLFTAIDSCLRKSVRETGNADIRAIAALLEVALDDLISREVVLLAIADYIAHALQGCVPDLETWDPPSLTAQ